jgi:hypothetical protein
MEKQLDPTLFDKKTTLVNFASSLLQHYGVTPFHSTIPEVDQALEGHKKVVVFLFDGASEYNLNLYPHQTAFMRDHKLVTIHSVNPATTVACTSSFLSGKFPIETGYLGWSLYFKEKGLSIDVFPNRETVSEKKLEGPNLMETTCPYDNLAKLMSAKGVKAACQFMAPLYDGTGPKNLKEVGSKAGAFFDQGGEFLYSYWGCPDSLLHKYGVKSWHIRHNLRSINKTVKKFCQKHPDVLVFTMADHGLIDVQYRDLAAFPEIEECLLRPYSIEGRTPTFWVKGDKHQQFEQAFAKAFGDKFYLMSREEVLEKGYFGEGTPNSHSLDFIGDYLAVALDKDILCDSSVKSPVKVHKGHHAGGTKEEREVLLGCYNR